LDLFALRFGKRFGKPINLLYVSSFALQRLLGITVFAQHEKSRDPNCDGEHASKSAVDQAEGDGVRFAQLDWHPIVYEGCSCYREWHGQQNDQEAQYRCGYLCQVSAFPFLLRHPSM
jgi:hypothetical protein